MSHNPAPNPAKSGKNPAPDYFYLVGGITPNPAAGFSRRIRREKSGSRKKREAKVGMTFDDPPTWLEAREVDGQRFVCIDWWPWLNAFGEPSALAVWATECAVCRKPMIATTIIGKRSYPSRRCTEHAKKGAPMKANKAP
jgi:hypothetical protein